MSDRILPAVFVSHGAPTLAIEQNETVTFLKQLGSELGRPRAVLCVSAHWGTRAPTLSAAAWPETIHDFGGFSRELYRMRYDAPGAPELAARGAELLRGAGLQSETEPERGLDHGAWIPLKLMYPEADIPVTQLSVQPQSGPAPHVRVGAALKPLRREGVLILASGGAVHNLGQFGREAGTPDWATNFDEWLNAKLLEGAYADVINYRALSGDGRMAHPTEEHLLPLFIALGAGGEGAQARALHRSFTHGSLSMAAYAFE